MRIDTANKSLDIEQRDIDYILTAYLRMYLFQTKNNDPDKITLPMFGSVPHPHKSGVRVRIEYIPDDSPVAVDIAWDGQDIPLTTETDEDLADEAENAYKETVAKVDELRAEVESPVALGNGSAIGGYGEQPSPERLARAKSPDSPLPPGTQSDYGGSRDPRMQKAVAQDLADPKSSDSDDEAEDNALIERAKKGK